MNEQYPGLGIRNVQANTEQGKAVQDNRTAAKNMRLHRKYSLELLDMAVARAGEIGLAAASAETGVSKKSIEAHAYTKKIEKQSAGITAIKQSTNQKYTNELKKQVVIKAFEIKRETGIPIKKAFINAGRLHGANGLTIHAMFNRGQIVM